MAEKGFGVKEINLIGASGTPTIESPNNLNLNAVNVAISTNVSIGGTLSVTGNVSVGGTLTYEDVTSIDSVGLITARSGVVTPNVDVDDFITVGSNIQLGNAGIITAITFAGAATRVDTSAITTNNIHSVTFQGSGSDILARSGVTNEFQYNPSARKLFVSNITGFYNSPSYDTALNILGGANVTGVVTATSFSGSGANLTSLPAATPTDSDIQVAYTVTANGSSAYRFAGNGVVSTADDPDLYLIRGQKYRFINNSGGSHPFQIREASGGTAYSTGVTNNGASSGNIDFAPTYDSPAQLVYQCTSHSGMVGNIYLRDAAGGNTNVGVTTFSGQVNIAGTPSSGGGLLNIKPGSGDDTFIKFRRAADFDGTFDGTVIDNRNSANNANRDLIVRLGKLAIWAGGTEKLRIGTAGQLGIGGANYGTSGQVLTSTGTSTGLSWATPMSVLISSTTVSSQVSSVTFTEALTGAFSTYGIYVVTINGLRFANDDRDLHCRIRTGTNGATQLSSSDYNSMTNGPSADDGFSTNSHWRMNYNNIGNEIAGSYIRETFNAVIYFYGFEANKRCRYHGMTTYQSSDGADRGQFINGTVTDASETTGLQFFSSSGNIALGKFSLFGVNG